MFRHHWYSAIHLAPWPALDIASHQGEREEEKKENCVWRAAICVVFHYH